MVNVFSVIARTFEKSVFIRVDARDNSQTNESDLRERGILGAPTGKN